MKTLNIFHASTKRTPTLRFPDDKVPRFISDTELGIEVSLKARMIRTVQDLIIQVGLRLPEKFTSFCILKSAASLNCQDVSCLFAFPFKTE